MTNIDFRDFDDIIAGPYAVAHLKYGVRLVRGIDRFTHLPTRERAAVVWVQRNLNRPVVQTETVALEAIKLSPGVQS